MKLTRNCLLSVLVFICCFFFVSNVFAVQPDWTKAQVVAELGQPDNKTYDPTYGEVWTYNMTQHRKKGFFDTLHGDTVIWNLSDAILPDFYSESGDSILDAFSSTTSTATEQGIGSVLKSKTPNTTSVVVIRFDSDGRVTGPRYNETQANNVPNTVTKQSEVSTPNKVVRNQAKTEETREIVIIENADKYGHAPEGKVFEVNGIGHKIKYCANVVGNQYDLVDKDDVEEMDECVPAF